MPDDSIDWEALLKASQGSNPTSESPSLITSCNEGTVLTGMEYFSEDGKKKSKPDE